MTTPCTDLTKLSVTDIAKCFAESTLTAVALATALLTRINTREALNAWTHVDPDQVLRRARAIDASRHRGPLAGTPVGIKDIIDTFDMPTAYGSPIYENCYPYSDASIVALMRSVGVMIMGKTVTTEFAFRHPSMTVNPHNATHTPGGSSSGSAAAVADFQVPFAIGTQTAGSIIRPAAYCGVVGYKPTYGDLPTVGIKACAPSLDTVGMFARSVDDITLVRSVLIGESASPRNENSLSPVIGLCRTSSWQQAERTARQSLEAVSGELAAGGATVYNVKLPHICDSLLESHRVINSFEMVASLADESARWTHLISTTTRDALEEGRRVTFEQYRAAQRHAERCRLAVDELLTSVDALLTPSTAGEAPSGLQSTGEPTFNSIWTLLHTPCITLPTGRGPANLPLGVQFVGRRGWDSGLLAQASWAAKVISAAGM